LDIGALEAEVLSVLKKFKRASARSIFEELARQRQLAYTTVSTTLDRLHKKGLVKRDEESGRGGMRYVYVYPQNPALQRNIAGKMVDRLVTAFGPSVVSSIYEKLSEIPDSRIEDLKKRVRRASSK